MKKMIKMNEKISNVNMVKPSSGMVVDKELNCVKSYRVGKGWLTSGTEGGGLIV